MLFSNCTSHPVASSQSQISVHANSHNSYQTGNHPHHGQPQHLRGSFVTNCMQAVCGIEPNNNSQSRIYSTTIEDNNSSLTANTHQHLNFSEDKCRITLSRFNKEVNGRNVRYIQAKATLFDDEVDEAHDLFYLVKIPESSKDDSSFQNSPATQNPATTATKRKTQQSRLFFPRNVNNAVPYETVHSHNQIDSTIPSPMGNEQPVGRQSTHDSAEQANTAAFNNSLRPAHTMTTQQNSTLGGIVLQRLQNQQQQETGSFTFAGAEMNYNSGVVLHGPASMDPSAQSETKKQLCEDSDYGIGLVMQSQPDRCDTETQRRYCNPAWENMLQQQSPARMLGNKSANNKHLNDVTLSPQPKAASNHEGQVSSITSSQLFHSQGEMDEFGHPMAYAQNKKIQNNGENSGNARLPRTYGDLLAKFTVSIRKDKNCNGQNVAIGSFPISKVPDGNYRIYYFRPKERNRIIAGSKARSSSAKDKIQRVGRGQEFYIFDKNSSYSPSKQPSQANSQDQSLSVSKYNSSATKTQQQSNQQSNKKIQKALHPISSVLNNRSPFINSQNKKGFSAMHSKLLPFAKTTSLSGQKQKKSGGSFQKPQGKDKGGSSTYFATVGKNAGYHPVYNKNRKISANSDGQLAVSATVPFSSISAAAPSQAQSKSQSSRNNFSGQVAEMKAGGSQGSTDRKNCRQDMSSGKSSNLNSTTTPKNKRICNNEEQKHSQSLHNHFSASSNQEGFNQNAAKLVEEICQVQQIQLKRDMEKNDTNKLAALQRSNISKGNPDASNPSQQEDSYNESSSLQNAMLPKFQAQGTYGGNSQSPHNAANDFPSQYVSQACKNKFLVHLNAVDKVIDRAMDEVTPSSSPFSKTNSNNQGAAIRFEKQMSYSNNKQGRSSRSSSNGVRDSDASNLAGCCTTSNNKASNYQQAQRESLQSATSAFAAAETAVRNSQIHMFSLVDDEGIFGPTLIKEADLLSSPDSNDMQQIQPEINIVNDNEDEENFEQVVTINELSQQPNKLRVLDQYTRIGEKKQISYLQQLLDTRGPSDDVVDYASLILPSPATTINVFQSDCSDQLLRNQHHLGFNLPHNQKHSRAIIFQDSTGNSNSTPDKKIQTDPEHEYQTDDSFRSPNKSDYQELIKLANTQNNQGTNFEQLTRNTNDPSKVRTVQQIISASDRKHLSTVEEENPSQCSDLISMQHHQQASKLLQQSSCNSGFSKKSLRSSMQPLQTVTVPKSFCLSDEDLTHLNTNNEAPDMIREMKSIQINNIEAPEPDYEELKFSLPQQIMTVNKADEDTYTEDIDDKSKAFGMMLGNNSATSTKTCSKQPSTAAISMGQSKESQINSGLSGLKISERASAQQTKPQSMTLTGLEQNHADDSSSTSLLDLDHDEKHNINTRAGCILAQINRMQQSLAHDEVDKELFFASEDGAQEYAKQLHFSLNILAQEDCISMTNQEEENEENKDDSAILMKFIERIPSSADEYSKQNLNPFSSDRVSNAATLVVSYEDQSYKNSGSSTGQTVTIQNTPQFQQISGQNSTQVSQGASRASMAPKQHQQQQQSSPLKTMPILQVSGRLSKGNQKKQLQKSSKAGNDVKAKAKNEVLQQDSGKENWKLGLSPVLQHRQQPMTRSRQSQSNNMIPILTKSQSKKQQQPSKIYQLIQKSVGSPQPGQNKRRKQPDSAFASDQKLAFEGHLAAHTFEQSSRTSTRILSPSKRTNSQTNFSNTFTAKQISQPLIKKKELFSSRKKEASSGSSSMITQQSQQHQQLQLKMTQTQLIKSSVTSSTSTSKRQSDSIPYQSHGKKAPGMVKSVVNPSLHKVMLNNFISKDL